MNRFSVRTRYLAIFAMTIALIMVITAAINNWGLRSYYERNKVQSMEHAYEEIDAAVRKEAYERLDEILDQYSGRENISIAVYDTLTNRAIVSSERDDNILLEHLRDRLFGNTPETEENLILETNSYRITLDDENLEFFGYCSDNRMMVMMSSPTEGMLQSAHESNRFFLFAAMVALVIGIIAIILLTKRVSRMAELEADNERLQHDLAEKEKQNRINQDFIANVSHELKTPIALIQGYAEGLSDGLCEDAESRKYYADIIQDEAARMNRIVQQLLLVNSLESGVEKPEMAIFNISEMAECITESTRLLAEQKNASLEKEIAPGLTAYGDSFKIESVITNYLSNAMNHVNEGGRILVKLEEMEDSVRFSVYNTGGRIPEDALEHIWDKFYKVDKAHTRTYGGSGIGLSIVKAVMEAHGEPYGADNKEEGVEFWFELRKK